MGCLCLKLARLGKDRDMVSLIEVVSAFQGAVVASFVATIIHKQMAVKKSDQMQIAGA